MGGIWSLSLLTMVTIFKAVFWSVDPIALTTFARSATSLALVEPGKPDGLPREENVPASVLGVAMVTSSVQISQQTSSSLLPAPVNQPRPPPFLRLFSKNCTASWPRTLPFPDEVEDSWRMSCPTRVSIRVSNWGSATSGRVRSKTSMVEGRRDGK